MSKEKEKPLSSNVVDMDRYRNARIADGSWPPYSGSDALQSIEYRSYWMSRRRKPPK